MWNRLFGLLLGVATAATLAGSCALLVRTVDLRSRESQAYRRLWGDLTWAINDLVDSRFPLSPAERANAGANPQHAYRVILLERTEVLGIKPWQFWRTFRPLIFRAHRGPFALGDFDDPGRAWLLSRCFRWLGAVSPYLILWLAVLLALPAVAWSVYELWTAGRRTAAWVFGLLLTTSPFIAEVLTLRRYAVGFYLVAALYVVALTLHVTLRQTVRLATLLPRFLASGAVLALCVACRSSSALLLGVATLTLSAWLVRKHRWRPASVVVLALCLVLPTLMARPRKHHDVWQPLWEGLGDFDRTKGHEWSDPAALAVVRQNDVPAIWTAEGERVLRRLVLEHVTGDPLWYVSILVKRALATATQWKLWPFAPIDGLHMRASASKNEGVIDKYYGYTTTVDHIGFGSFAREMPIVVFPLVTAMFLAHSWWGKPADEYRRARQRADAAAVALPALCCLAVPVAVTTAGAQETQTFGIVYFLASALLADRILGYRPRSPSHRSATATHSLSMSAALFPVLLGTANEWSPWSMACKVARGSRDRTMVSLSQLAKASRVPCKKSIGTVIAPRCASRSFVD